jgi:hypothetical protein
MFSGYVSLSEPVNGFSFSSEAVSEIGLVILIGFLLIFLGHLLR